MIPSVSKNPSNDQYVCVFEGFYLLLVWLPQTPPQEPTPDTAGRVETREFTDKWKTISASPQTHAACASFAGKRRHTPCCTPAEWRLVSLRSARGTRWWRWVLTAAAALDPKSREARRAPPTLTSSLQLEGFSPGSQLCSSVLQPEHQGETTTTTRRKQSKAKVKGLRALENSL